MKIYEYTISDYNEYHFKKQCERLEKNPKLKGIHKEHHGVVTDVDGSQIVVYFYKGKVIKVINDIEENECIVSTPYNMEELLDVKFENPIFIYDDEDEENWIEHL